MVFLEVKKQDSVFHIDKFSLHQELLQQEEYCFRLVSEESAAKGSHSSSDSNCPRWNIRSVAGSSQNNKRSHLTL